MTLKERLIEKYEEKQELVIEEIDGEKYLPASFVNFLIDELEFVEGEAKKALALLQWDKTAEKILKVGKDGKKKKD